MPEPKFLRHLWAWPVLALPPSRRQRHQQRRSCAIPRPILPRRSHRRHHPAGAQTLVLSGQVPPVIDATADRASIAAYGDTATQTVGVLHKIEAALKQRGFGLGDVVKLTVYLVGDPAKGGKLDFAGFSQGYGQFFGTAQQPNKVARTTVQVAALANPGFLVEIEATAAKAPDRRSFPGARQDTGETPDAAAAA
jgi:enamine deaminase RidA (YjgF/YER057c/UK114 family)